MLTTEIIGLLALLLGLQFYAMVATQLTRRQAKAEKSVSAKSAKAP